MLTVLPGELLAERTGATPPAVVALHGWMRTGADFTPVVAGLDAVAVHFPGMGVTPEPPEAWGSAEYAAALARAIEPFGPVVIAAHSFGGRVAAHLAQQRPELVRGILLTGVPLVRLTAAPRPALSYRLVRSLARARLLPASVLEAQRRRRGSADYNAVTGRMREVFVRVVGESYPEQLAALAALCTAGVPVRMLWGEHDSQAPADAGRAASELIAGSRFRLVPGAGHQLEGPLREAVRAELLELLQEVR
ncbi:MAG: alpha/beta hydrolase [Microbacteriaceae bacterium]